jgi:DNA-binding MarR family transcriptional regulator
MTSEPAISPRELEVYFALLESATLLRYQVEQHLKAEAGIGYVQFEILASLVDAGGELTMTVLADKLVHSRSGLTHQIGLLEKSGYITRAPNPEDKRSTIVRITGAGRSTVATVMPGHIAIAREMFLDQLDAQGLDALSSTLPAAARKMRSTTQARSQRPRK